MALSANKNWDFMDYGYEIDAPAGADDIFYKGALVNFNTAGYIVVASDTANETFAGIVSEYVSNSGGSAGDVNVRVRRAAKAWITHTSAAQTDVGAYFHASADDTISDGEGTNIKEGYKCIKFRTGDLLIDFTDKIKTA